MAARTVTSPVTSPRIAAPVRRQFEAVMGSVPDAIRAPGDDSIWYLTGADLATESVTYTLHGERVTGCSFAMVPSEAWGIAAALGDDLDS